MMLRKFSFSWKSNVVPLESNLCVLSPKPCIVVICMNTQRIGTQILDEEIANSGFSPSVNQYPFLEIFSNDDQAPANPPALSDGDIREDFLKWSKPLRIKHKTSLLKLNP